MNAIRKLQFMVKGYLDFTRNQKPLPPLPGRLDNKTFVITGGNSGIGFEAAQTAAQQGANVVLICRSKERGEEAVEKIKKATQSNNVHLVLCELGEQESMKKASQQLKNTYKQIDVLVHNGGCMLHERQFTKEQIEKNFAVNTFSIYYLSTLLMPMMRNTSRTITVSSGGCLTQKLETDDIYMEKEDFDGTAQYARNKRQQLCIIEELAKKYPEHGKFFSMHPGWADTPALRDSMPDFYKKMKEKLKTPAEAADTILYLATAPIQELKSGQFYYERKIADKHLPISFTSYKQEEADKLMARIRDLAKLE